MAEMTMEQKLETHKAVHDVLFERLNQHARWGEQNHPDGTGSEGFQRQASVRRAATDLAAKQKRLTWRHILLEEVFEALAESDPVRLREELIQTAAVATAWVEAIDRRS